MIAPPDQSHKIKLSEIYCKYKLVIFSIAFQIVWKTINSINLENFIPTSAGWPRLKKGEAVADTAFGSYPIPPYFIYLVI